MSSRNARRRTRSLAPARAQCGASVWLRECSEGAHLQDNEARCLRDVQDVIAAVHSVGLNESEGAFDDHHCELLRTEKCVKMLFTSNLLLIN